MTFFSLYFLYFFLKGEGVTGTHNKRYIARRYLEIYKQKKIFAKMHMVGDR